MKSTFAILYMCALSLNGAFGKAPEPEVEQRVSKRAIHTVGTINAGIVNNYGREKRGADASPVQEVYVSREKKGVIGHVDQIDAHIFNNREKRGYIGHVGQINTGIFNNGREKRGVIGHVDNIDATVFNNREKRGYIGHVGEINTQIFNNREKRGTIGHVGQINAGIFNNGRERRGVIGHIDTFISGNSHFQSGPDGTPAVGSIGQFTTVTDVPKPAL